MITLQEYLLENLDEGKIWDSIKGWFKSLFEPSDKEFDRYGKDDNRIEGSNLVKFKKYLEENFTEDSIDIKQFDIKNLQKVIRPNGVEPSNEEKFGFYEFAGELDENSNYFGLVYDDKKVKDTSCLINSKTNGTDIELIKLQTIEEFVKYLPLNNIIKLLKNNSDFIGKANRLVIKEKVNKNLYNQAINDCGFEKLYENNENIAALNLNKKE